MMDAPKTVDRIRSTGTFGQFPGAVLAAVGHDTYILEAEVAKLVADAEARGVERAAEICAGLADQVSDAALTGLPEQARLRESMEAAFTKARHAIRAEAAAIRRAAEGEKP
ncbi:MAG: hypothetical protein C0524_20345 [Rhodobacter sp.]|nr:hypothetical protein [Rhodobacter sp.]